MSHSEEGPGRRGWGTHSPTMSKGGPEAEGGAGVSSHHPDLLVCICQRAPADLQGLSCHLPGAQAALCQRWAPKSRPRPHGISFLLSKWLRE